MNHLKTIFDWPPVWTLAGIGLIFGLDQIWSLQNHPLPGAVVILAGGLLMMVAAAQMLALRTTVNPRGQPAVLVTNGVFRLSRNPIYLGDALVLLGVVVWLGAPLGLCVVAGFVAVITQRFILAEELRLHARFGDDFAHWRSRVRRWI
ncbi:MAG TPA: S-isoprenylcysteine methyltransferase [Gemmobacter sp.]|nr:S-isoprenylcysteine methyltransferase [Gemmobacter sp.]HBU15963.1 S-isoprenylcysteine methyltransferase [Gemmobacter sp.]